MNEKSEELLVKLALVKQGYAQKLPAAIDQIIAAWKSLQTDTWDQDNLDALIFKVHKLTGSSGTLGFMNISQISSRIEELLRKAKMEGKRLDKWQIAKIDEIILELKHALIILDEVNNPKIDGN